MEFEYTQGHWFDQLKAIIFYTSTVDHWNFYLHILSGLCLKKKYALELPFLEIYK